MIERDELVADAHHEAAHAVIGSDHGRSVHAVSIRPGASHAGITIWEPASSAERVLSAALEDGRHPLDGLMPDAFRHACRRVVMVLAGKVAADIAVPVLGREPVREDPAPTPAPSPPREPAAEPSARLLAAEATPESEVHDDDAVAFEMAYGLVGYRTIGPFLAWMRAEADRAVRDRWPVISAVASELLATDHLDAARFRAIYQGDADEA